MKLPSATLITAVICLFTLSRASHAPPETNELSTQVALPNGKEFVVAVEDLPKIPIRLVNRRFPIRSKRPCRHSHHRKILPVEIFPGGENGDFQEPIVSGRLLRLRRHRGHGEGFDRVDEAKGIRVWKKTKKVKEGGFVRRVRKFMDNYF